MPTKVDVIQIFKNFQGALSKILLTCFILLAPIHATMGAVGTLIILDMFTGVWAAIKQKEKVTSARMRDTISKMVIYQIAVISGFIVEKYIMNDLFPVSRLVAGTIALVELSSLLENINIISGTNIFDALIKKLGSKNNDL